MPFHLDNVKPSKKSFFEKFRDKFYEYSDKLGIGSESDWDYMFRDLEDFGFIAKNINTNNTTQAIVAPSVLSDNGNGFANKIKSLIPRFNKFAKFYGYSPVLEGSSIKDAVKTIKQGLAQHNTFYRGLTVPTAKEDILMLEKELGKNPSKKAIIKRLAEKGSRNPNNTYVSPDVRASQYAKEGDVAIIKRKYKLSPDPTTWLDDADFVFDTTPAVNYPPKDVVNYPWASSMIEKAPPGEIRLHPDNYTVEGFVPKKVWEYGTYADPKSFAGSKNLYFNERLGHHKPKFRLGGISHINN